LVWEPRGRELLVVREDAFLREVVFVREAVVFMALPFCGPIAP
jgi:hypothetical protein